MDIEEANDLLRSQGIRLRIILRGESLSLRGMFPSRRDPGKRSQTALALGIGIHERDSIAKAFNLGIQVYRAIQSRTFSWSDWGLRESDESGLVSEWIGRYEKYYLTTYGEGAEERWRVYQWKYGLKHLPLDKKLTKELLIEVLTETWSSEKSTRKIAARIYQQFADYAEIDIDLSKYAGSFVISGAKRKVIPTDDDILSDREIYKDRRYRVLFDRMICYGLRDHESYFCRVDSEPPYLCHVMEGKTGPRENIPPMHYRWAEEWRPWESFIPDWDLTEADRRTAKAYRIYVGQRVANEYRLCHLPKERSPMGYRHAYALRAALDYEIELIARAAFMGHSPTVHLNTYNRYIQKGRALKTYLEKISVNRGKPSISHQNTK